MKKKFSIFLLGVMLTTFAAFSQIGTEETLDDGSGCLSTTENNGFCNKYSGTSGLPSYYCQTTSIHNAQCNDCVK